jgi:ribosomal protein S21
VEVREGQDLLDAIRKLNKQVREAHGRAWVKRRLGYFEKPTVLRRKRAKVGRLNKGSGVLKLGLNLNRLLARTGPFAAGY